MDEYCKSKSKEFTERGYRGRFGATPENSREDGTNGKRKHEKDEEDITLMSCAFVRNNYVNDVTLPKTQLIRWTNENRKKIPRYETFQEEKMFRSIVEVDGKKFSSTFW